MSNCYVFVYTLEYSNEQLKDITVILSVSAFKEVRTQSKHTLRHGNEKFSVCRSN